MNAQTSQIPQRGREEEMTTESKIGETKTKTKSEMKGPPVPVPPPNPSTTTSSGVVVDGMMMLLTNGHHQISGPRQILSVFYAEFDIFEGPRIFFQTPFDFFPSETFRSISEYVIPRKQLCSKFTSVRVGPYIVLGYPICIDDTKYPRNVFSFNVCVVVRERIGVEQLLEQPLKKLGSHLRIIELESEFLSKKKTKARMGGIVKQLFLDLNMKGHTTIQIDKANSIHLNLYWRPSSPPLVLAHHVPVCIAPALMRVLASSDSDLCMRALVPHIDGVRSVLQISHVADVDIEVTRAALRNLLHYQLITLVDIFQFSNMYGVVPDRIGSFLNEMKTCGSEARKASLQFLSFDQGPLPSLSDVISVILDFHHGQKVSDICVKHESKLSLINIRRLITFCLINGALRRIHEYVVPTNFGLSLDLNDPVLLKLPQKVREMIRRGTHYYDEFCCVLMCGKSDLDKLFRSSSEISVLYR